MPSDRDKAKSDAVARLEHFVSVVRAKVLWRGSYPPEATFIPGPPAICMGEQIRRCDDGGYLVANCGHVGLRKFSNLNSAVEFFVDSVFVGRPVSPGYFMRESRHG